jgi:hypothetical protein
MPTSSIAHVVHLFQNGSKKKEVKFTIKLKIKMHVTFNLKILSPHLLLKNVKMKIHKNILPLTVWQSF